MVRLERRQFRLSAPDEAKLQRSRDKIAALYNDAYGWMPPRIEIGERLAGKSMRQYIKSWITTWDILRLYGEVPVITGETIAIDYTESSEIERAVVLGDEEDSA
jgi:hypothetical protein